MPIKEELKPGDIVLVQDDGQIAANWLGVVKENPCPWKNATACTSVDWLLRPGLQKHNESFIGPYTHRLIKLGNMNDVYDKSTQKHRVREVGAANAHA